MGSTYIERTYDVATETEMRVKFNGACEEAKREYGYNRYSGELNNIENLTVLNRTFKSDNELADYMDGYDSNVAVAVRFQMPKKSFEENSPKRYAESVEAISAASREEERVRRLVIETVRQGVRKTRLCRKCGSSIAVAYLRGLACPLCSNEEGFLTKSEAKPYVQATTKRERARKRMDDEVAVYNAKAPIKTVWRVGAWVKT